MRSRNARSRRAGSWPSTSTLAGVGAAVALEDLDERRLAGAVGTEQGEQLAAADREVDAVERLHGAVGLAHAADLDGGLGVDKGGCHARQHADCARRLVIGAGVEPAPPPTGGDGSTRAPMTPPQCAPYRVVRDHSATPSALVRRRRLRDDRARRSSRPSRRPACRATACRCRSRSSAWRPASRSRGRGPRCQTRSGSAASC